jgi:DNA repair protein RecN (Recombination protein N)
MLEHLLIQNYALIHHLDIRFHRGFSAITGETGAGKSILMDALDLVLGKRADTQVLLSPDRKCVVEGTFAGFGKRLQPFFELHDLDEEEILTLRREISPNGKSRAFINDTPVNLNVLKSLGDMLVDIHAQHATTSLQDPEFQLSVIDSYAGTEELLGNYQHLYRLNKTKKGNLQDLLREEAESRKTSDYRQFLLGELTEANIAEGEQEELEEQMRVMTHAEEIKSSLFRAIQILEGEEGGVIDQLSEAGNNLGKVSGYHHEIELLRERLETGLIDLKEIARELSKLDQGIDFNSEQMEVARLRLDLIYRLQQKHHVNTCAELIRIMETLQAEMNQISSLDDQIKALGEEIEALDLELIRLATELSSEREKSFIPFAGQVVSLLQHMGMPEARFEVIREKTPAVNVFGQDKIEFYFNANKGHSLKPIADIASGGELSRVMLSIKSLISKKKMLPTIVFDEIDNGLSGDVAGRVGDILTRMSSGIQVIAITHLPQIAGKADHQYTVYKEVKDQITYSNIRILDEPGRLTELATMIGGKNSSPAAFAAAKELLASSQGLSQLFENN